MINKKVLLAMTSVGISVHEATRAINSFKECTDDNHELIGNKRRNKSDRKRSRADRWR